jgi:uncharacterized membrane protein YhfC
MPAPEQAMTIGLLASIATAAIGIAVAWWLRRRTTLSVRNLYVLAVALLALFSAALATQLWVALLLLGPALPHVVKANGSTSPRRARSSASASGPPVSPTWR